MLMICRKDWTPETQVNIGKRKWGLFATQSFHVWRPDAFTYNPPFLGRITGAAWYLVMRVKESSDCLGGSLSGPVQRSGSHVSELPTGSPDHSLCPSPPCPTIPLLLGTLNLPSVNLFSTGCFPQPCSWVDDIHLGSFMSCHVRTPLLFPVALRNA